MFPMPVQADKQRGGSGCVRQNIDGTFKNISAVLM